ncbi:hypothetical protein GIB19_27900 [Pseudomonas sp. ITEM 17296]|uniref:hypothetical protein n=1 Tax=Pseudomonas sp. ITEM 17296 TaxID=2790281 RepID=UPI00235CFCAB|nr:hypothetical protein [Pseudomonas sp. ITEM 17296]MDE4541029.1 hypothetical protein [Pseudomonas sp. ITEM 17296]GLO58908.1 hypothetical protein PPUJ20066_49440 [Pseudomonas putida]
MYDDFLSNIETYTKLEELFKSAFAAHTKTTSSTSHYITPFYNTTFKNGQPFRNANPIFSALNLKSKKLIRIIIEENEHNISVVEKKTDHGTETIIFGGTTNLSEILIKMQEWITLSEQQSKTAHSDHPPPS